ncbi:SRPBCC family protein [Flavobacterium sp.]|uniref:SRPBCC family protein n=1 Tax=Flavobacterium sp. TaxID=239 RepID=UPI0028BDD59E|nr:SRPBCC family protein [Flavobacterium sp.]
MKILKGILLFVVGVIALFLIAGLFVAKDYAVEKEVTINKPEAEVFSYVKHLKNQDNFSVWNKMDPNSKKDYKGTDGQVGFIAAWDSENPQVGKGEQEIVNIVDNERIDIKLRFKEPFEAEDDAYFVTEAVDSTHTKVKWGFKGHMDYPSNLMLLAYDMEKELGGALQTGLEDLKKVLEQ